ncbi:MAG: MFS transporter [Halanaerobiales bacterium]|nr:MFS transporter [Halanaerobiales bacterium]
MLNNDKNLENKNLILFLSGKSISLFGTAIYTFVVGLYLLKTTGSGLTFATNIVLYTLPIVFINPFAGVMADKMNKKKVVVGSDLLNGVFLLVIYLLAQKIGLSTFLVYISTFLMTVLSVFFNIGIESAKPNLVKKESLVKINSLARIIESISHLIGPVIGGLIYVVVDTKIFILINAISFLFAALIEYFIDYDYNKKPDDQSLVVNKFIYSNVWSKMKEGYDYIFNRSHLRGLVYIFIGLNFFFNFTIIVPLPYLLNSVWKVDSFIYGIVQSGLPIGMILGALSIKKILNCTEYSILLKKIGFYSSLIVLGFALPIVVISDSPSQNFILFYYTLLMIISGIIVSLVDIPASVLLQNIVPEKLLGRVISVKLSIIKIVVPITLLLSGYLLELVPISIIFLIGSIIFLLFNIFFFISTPGKDFINVSEVNMV